MRLAASTRAPAFSSASAVPMWPSPAATKSGDSPAAALWLCSYSAGLADTPGRSRQHAGAASSAGSVDTKCVLALRDSAPNLGVC